MMHVQGDTAKHLFDLKLKIYNLSCATSVFAWKTGNILD